jgi:ribosomal protein S2
MSELKTLAVKNVKRDTIKELKKIAAEEDINMSDVLDLLLKAYGGIQNLKGQVEFINKHDLNSDSLISGVNAVLDYMEQS